MMIFNQDDWDDYYFRYHITDDELRMICELTPTDILAHMKKSIGVITPLGATKLIPCIMLGKLEISVQINYQLWSMRQDLERGDDNSPISIEEFNQLVPNINHRNIDVRIRYDEAPFLPATQMSLSGICDFIGSSIIGE